MDNQYESMTLATLREIAKEKGLKNIASLKKSELISALIQFDSTQKEAKQVINEEKKVTKAKSGARSSDEVVSEQVETGIRKKPKVNTEAKTDNRVENKEENRSENIVDNRIENRAESKIENKAEERTEYKVESRPEGRPERPLEQRVPRPEPRTGMQSSTEARFRTDITQDILKEDKVSHSEMDQLDSGETKVGILEVLPDGYGFIRCDNYLPGENDVYVSPAQIRRFNLKTGDIVTGNTRIRSQNEKFSALLYVKSVNGFHPNEAQKRKRFEDLTPIFPNERIHLETPGAGVSMRMVDLISPIGKGQRGMIVSQPKTGKTTLLKQIAKAVTRNHPEMKLIILLIDERPEEVTDIKESIEGKNVEVIYSTFDELPENHKRVSEMVIERAKRLVEHKQDVIILLDSITRLARAYNLTVQPSGRTLSGGLDPAALHMPKRFFGAARNMREGGSLTILATALVDTGSRMDDVVFEEFKGTGNMELSLDRSLSEKRIFPAIDLPRSSTRREDLLLSQSEMEATYLMRKALGGLKSEEALERIIDMFLRTKSNAEFIEMIKKTKIVF
ncbi:transcription termination factor Rho [Lachnospiraceae bacterium MD1]|uniref:Transcription termination factor Rho n=1 Tax=Variimorphobacter saccharofermentans TaxID=2755051 RepID=A0A839JYC7_9FIRM|nr:transcription termination factor Rho [Variimorphobacter saccharofermentans]MBB2181619.1 transcription termination factor Rho [Variimorphobacter saccharofermentans]